MAYIVRMSLARLSCPFKDIVHQQNNYLKRNVLGCVSCQRLQRSQLLDRRGFAGFRHQRKFAKAAEQSQSPTPLRCDSASKAELSNVLQARVRQLEANTDQRTWPPDRLDNEPPHNKQADPWREQVARFQQQMYEQRDTDMSTPPHNVEEPLKDTTQNKKAPVKHMVVDTEQDMPETKLKKRQKARAKKKQKPTTSSNKNVMEADQHQLSGLSQDTVNPQLARTRETGRLQGKDQEVINKVKLLLIERNTDEEVIERVVSHLQQLVEGGKIRPGSLKTSFWKPTKLRNMAEVREALEVVEKLYAKMPIIQTEAVQRELARQQENRSQQYTEEMRAYIDACLHAGMVGKAHAALMVRNPERKTGRQTVTKRRALTVTDVQLYNSVLAAWAKKGDLERLQRLLTHMRAAGLTPNIDTYATWLECLGRRRPLDRNAVESVLGDITSLGVEPEDIPQLCSLQHEQWNHVTEAIECVRPLTEQSRPMADDGYRCRLLSHLNGAQDSEKLLNPHCNVMPAERLRNQARQQLNHEKRDMVAVRSIVAPGKPSPWIQEAREKLETCRQQWKQCLVRAFRRDLSLEEKRRHNVSGLSVVPFLKLFPAATYVNLMMQEIETLALETENYSPSISLLQRQFGFRINRHFLVRDRIKSGYIKKMSPVYEDYLTHYLDEQQVQPTHRQMFGSLLARHSDNTGIDMRSKLWPSSINRMVGRWLYRLILMDLKVNANLYKDNENNRDIPAFYTVFRQQGPAVQEVIKPHPLLVRLYQHANIESLTFDTTAMPSLTPPLPWHRPNSGGNLLSTTSLIINPSRSLEQIRMLDTLPPEQLNPVYDALNVLSATPWTINQPVLDLVMDKFRAGGDRSLDIPPPASSCPEPPKMAPGMTDEEKVAVLRERELVRKERQETHSLWMTELYRLSIANHFRDNIFWFPHNMDFRSRVYATPPHFNHLGSDLARSLLLFATGRPLGQHGLRWLKIHLVNLTGHRKRSSNEERLAFADEHLSDILDSADNPMTGQKWWQDSDEPWQTLACCMEVAKAVRSPDPTQYVSHLPVHQDGSCNGLQHYAALGRDQAGAESVNLYPSSSPKDVYSDVVELVEIERKKDAAGGNEVAAILEGFVKRKVIKQTIMTTVYGVTRFGARLQIEGQLKDLPDFPPSHVFNASLYLTQKTFYCLQQMFMSTKEIQDWFTVCAKMAASLRFRFMEWTTPLGWPVIQPYFRPYDASQLLVVPKNTIIEIPNTQRQKNGFPPNFIHSLDSTHMMLTALHCQRAGINFVSVHDCFWTHATDVATMNKVCRDQFVALHKEPILEDLSKTMHEKYGLHSGNSEEWHQVDPVSRDFVNHVLQRVPKRGSFDLNKVRESTYFFS